MKSYKDLEDIFCIFLLKTWHIWKSICTVTSLFVWDQQLSKTKSWSS